MKESLQVKIPGTVNNKITFRLHMTRAVNHLEILSETRECANLGGGGGGSPHPHTDVETQIGSAVNEASWSDEIDNPQAKVLFWAGS